MAVPSVSSGSRAELITSPFGLTSASRVREPSLGPLSEVWGLEGKNQSQTLQIGGSPRRSLVRPVWVDAIVLLRGGM